MNPHSRHSQFNQRAPKTGPLLPSSRSMESTHPQKPLVDNFSKRPATPSRKASSGAQTVPRPIATNSRIKQDEKYRKDMYLSFVNNALQQKTNGNTEAFDELVNQFNPNNITADGAPYVTQLRLWISALSHVVSRLERTHSALVEVIVAMPWTTMDSATVRSYTFFIGMLLSARPEYLSLTLAKIAQGFTHQSGIQALDSGMPENSSSPLTRRVIYDRLHDLLCHLLSLIPTLPSTLQPLLVRNFPHKRQNQVAQTTYIRNLLRISEYCPELADKILATIIDRAIQIDVEIQVELEDLDEEETAEDQDLFELDPFDTAVGQEEESDSDGDDEGDDDNLSDLSSDAGGMDDDGDAYDLPVNVQHISEMVRKLDATLKLIFDHFDRAHAVNPSQTKSALRSDSPSSMADSIDPPRPSSPVSTERKALRRSQFHILLSIFDRIIIRTFKSRYTQFLVFWYSSLDPEFTDLFQGMLVSKALLEPDQPAVTRAAAASYIASFVSRAQFVDRDAARNVTGVLCKFLQNQLDTFDAASQSGAVLPGIAHYSVFYAVSQAVFLIFCFRWRDLLEDMREDYADEVSGDVKPAKKWMAELGVVQRMVTSALNPLKVCSANVVKQFARVAHATGFIYCYSVMESNKRSEYAANNSDAHTGRGHQPPIHAGILANALDAELNTFFPFDPYKLPQSNSYIQGVYREWSAVALDEEEDDDDDEGDDGGSADDVQRDGYLSIRPRDDETGLGESLGAMSISPARPGTLAMSVL